MAPRDTPNPFQSNVLFYGDNIDILSANRNPPLIPNESVDLIYLDPPFNSKADYNILFKEKGGEQSSAQIQAFTDFWKWDKAAVQTKDYLTVGNKVDDKIATAATALYSMLGKNDMTAYIFMMTTRLIELHRVLKNTGSIFLHCDPTASHYLKVIMDAIFDARNFRNELIWRRSHPKGLAFTRFASNHDTILYYAKDAKSVKWNPSYNKYDYQEKPPAQYNHRDPDGRWFTLDNLLNPNRNRPNLTYEFRGRTCVWRWTKERMQAEDAKGRIIVPRDGKGMPRYKRYYDEQEGIPVDDFWDDIEFAKGTERLGFQTQKPLALLERIIEAGTDKGDWVLDPFCGCGTAVVAAEKLNRHWVGIDITYLAINIMKNRLNGTFPHADFKIRGAPRDIEAATALATQDKLNGRYQFQCWAQSLIGAVPRGSTAGNPIAVKKGADQVIDGIMRFGDGNGGVERIIVQVKSGHVDVTDIRELRDALSKHDAAMGIFITLQEPTSEMVKEVNSTKPYTQPTWQREYPKLQILTVAELLKGKKPDTPPTVNPFLEATIETRASTVQYAKLA